VQYSNNPSRYFNTVDYTPRSVKSSVSMALSLRYGHFLNFDCEMSKSAYISHDRIHSSNHPVLSYVGKYSCGSLWLGFEMTSPTRWPLHHAAPRTLNFCCTKGMRLIMVLYESLKPYHYLVKPNIYHLFNPTITLTFRWKVTQSVTRR